MSSILKMYQLFNFLIILSIMSIKLQSISCDEKIIIDKTNGSITLTVNINKLLYSCLFENTQNKFYGVQYDDEQLVDNLSRFTITLKEKQNGYINNMSSSHDCIFQIYSPLNNDFLTWTFRGETLDHSVLREISIDIQSNILNENNSDIKNETEHIKYGERFKVKFATYDMYNDICIHAYLLTPIGENYSIPMENKTTDQLTNYPVIIDNADDEKHTGIWKWEMMINSTGTIVTFIEYFSIEIDVDLQETIMENSDKFNEINGGVNNVTIVSNDLNNGSTVSDDLNDVNNVLNNSNDGTNIIDALGDVTTGFTIQINENEIGNTLS